jgi:hypothetical protein
MAKNTVKIGIDVDDKGTTKKVGLDAKKTGKGLDGVTNSSRNAQKGIKGVAQTASAGGKNFAGMSRGMGGVVGAYAALAAQMFAITAAFGFFKRAGDLKVLEQGQLAYASATGIAMKTLANDIIAATDAQITFKEASQATAIGISSGLSADQLTRLGTAAKDASAILGRDVTDAFNRLVRGVTKAEPELLDELGIILRLDTANRNYAESLGIAVKDLTQFQKSQAVANEVLNQSEAKYSAILAITGGSAVNQFNKLAKSMDDLVMRLQAFLLPAANGFAKALGDIPLVAGAGFLLLLKGPMQAMGVSMAGLGVSAKAAQTQQQLLYDTITNGATKAEAAITRLKNKQDKRMSKAALKTTSGSVTTQRLGEQGYHSLSKKDQNQIKRSIKKVEGTYKRHETITKGIFKGLKAGIVMDMTTGFKEIAVAEKALDNADTVFVSRWKLRWASMKVSITSTAAAVGAFASKALAWAGWIGIAVTVFATLWNMFKKEIPKTAAEIALERHEERVKSLITEYRDLGRIQEALFELNKDKVGGEQWAAALGNVLGSTGVAGTKQLFKDAISFQQKNDAKKVEDLKGKRQGQLAAADLFSDTKNSSSMSAMGLDVDETVKRFKNAINIIDAKIVKIQERANKGGYKLSNEPISDAEKDADLFISEQIKKVKQMDDAIGGGGMSKSITAYANALKKMRDDARGMSDEEVEALLKLKARAEQGGQAFAQLNKLQKESNDSIRGYFKSFAPLNAAESSMITISTEMKNLQQTIEDAGSSHKAQEQAKTRKALLTEEYALIKEINDAEHDRKILSMQTAEIAKEAGRMRHKIYKANAVQEAKVLSAQTVLVNARAEESTLNKIIEHQTKAKNAGQTTYIDHLGTERDINDENTRAQKHQLKVIKEKITAGENLVDWEKELLLFSNGTLENQLAISAAKMDQKLLGFEKTMMTNENKRLQYAKERLKLLKQEREIALEGALRAERESNPFAYLSEEKRTAELKYDMAVANRVGDKALIEEEAAMKLAQNDVEYDLLRLKYILLDLEMAKIQAETTAKTGDLRGQQTTIAESYMGPAEIAKHNAIGLEITRLEELNTKLGEYGPRINTLIAGIDGKDGLRQAGKDAIQDAARGKINKLDAAIEKLLEAKNRLMDINVISDTVAHSFEENMTSAFTSLIQGTASAKEAFSNMAMSILKDISAMIVKMMVFRMLNSLFTASVPMDAGMTDYVSGYNVEAIARTGGVFSQGKKMQGYSTGGVARGSTSGYPATLHGTEAVVPLPNGRSIPVEMKDSGATNNNIVVNISSEGQSNTQGSTGPDMDKMGGAIARAVQEELHNQKRSGGILNPYGAA